MDYSAYKRVIDDDVQIHAARSNQNSEGAKGKANINILI
jgi:hypothetical protein